ncbi:hypothetical protein P3W85_19555 [Cupriavidus basilensis]|uniref:Uncharacterized protein n=1 Tax=Cupriavidus basilensis TaxID=68895 RepID=A0ABT6AR86_9BURK|nr:hypothetical protein [Cupriavidus basilensis]MDF3835140.1 hypothetical protein [Cupriavidus basilensis]
MIIVVQDHFESVREQRTCRKERRPVATEFGAAVVPSIEGEWEHAAASWSLVCAGPLRKATPEWEEMKFLQPCRRWHRLAAVSSRVILGDVGQPAD